MFMDCVAMLYTQGVGGKKSARIVMWECYIVSLRCHSSLENWLFTVPRVDG